MKKKLLLSFGACLLASGALMGQLTPELLYYQFDGAGTTVPNLAQTPPPGTTNATIMGGITQGPGTTSLCGGSLIGSGLTTATDNVNTGWATSLSGSWSISFRSVGISTNTTLYYVFGDPTAGGFRCFTNGIAGSTNFVLRGTGITDAFCNGCALTTPTMSTWVYDQAANTIYVYLNGNLVSTVVQAGTPSISAGTGFKLMGYNSTNVGAPAGGQMDDFRVYSRALSAVEVAALYSPTFGDLLGGDTTHFCFGDSVYLAPSGSWTSTLWSTGATTQWLSVNTPGSYYVDVNYGLCGAATDTIEVIERQAALGNIVASSCTGSYTAPSGAIFSNSGIYQDTISSVYGCDSIITLDLTIGLETSSSFFASGCGSFTLPSGILVTQTGIYQDTIPNASGCDSVMTLDVTIHQPAASSYQVTACNSYTDQWGQTYSASGFYSDTLSTSQGCDSIVTLDLTIQTLSASFSQAGNTLTASPAGFSYQWVNCDSGFAAIPGANTQDFNPSVSGNYAVMVWDSICSDTSACQNVTIVGVSGAIAPQIQIFPNPTSGMITVNASISLENARIRVLTADGREALVLNQVNGLRHELNLNNLPAGVYLMEVLQGNQIVRERVIKQ